MKNFPQPKTFPPGAKLIDGVWAQVLAPKETTNNRPALFLDRDGVVCVEKNYMQRVEDVVLTPGAIDIIKLANKKNIPAILVTNQAGIGYGYYGWDEFANVQARLLDDISSLGGAIDGVFACPFHEKGVPPWDHPSHPARKPNPGMILMAAEFMGVDLNPSWIIGDRTSDILAGKNAGLAGGMHVLTGHGTNAGERENALSQASGDFAVKVGDDISFADKLLPLLAQ